MSEIIKNNRKIAVVLLNLGGPDNLNAVKPFLFNLFNDKNIITLPSIIRFFLAKIIARARENTAKKIYSNLGGKTPLLEETLLQKKSLKKELDKYENLNFEIFICMRHWHPMAEEVIKNVNSYDPEEIILLPLYPQFSTTTTGSSIENFHKILKNKYKKTRKIKTICCYPIEENFINAHVSIIKDKLKKNINLSDYRMLFSAHGLPEKIIKNGDPYQWQVEQTVRRITDKLKKNAKFTDLDCRLTYQSRVGPLKWLGPSTEDEIKEAGYAGKSLIIVPVAFVSEHVETLVELDIEYKEIASQYEIDYIRIPALGTNELFIQSLANMVLNYVTEERGFEKEKGDIIFSGVVQKICPDTYNKCPCRK